MDSPCYTCPGQQHPISRAVHLGRLAAFYPTCRECPHRHDTGTLSPRQIEQLQEVRAAGAPQSLFHDEGAGGVYLNQLTPANARDIAAAFAAMLREGREERGEGRENDECGMMNDEFNPLAKAAHHSSFIIHHSSIPSVLLSGDGRPITAETIAAVGEGLRFGGCNVIDIGPATAACLAFAVHHLQAAGGILVGNPGQQPHIVGLQFWVAGPRPLSAGGSIEPLAELFRSGVDRPARRCGELRRMQADAAYLAVISQLYHALRPLRVVIDSASRPVVEYLRKLAANVACEVIPCRATRCDLPEQIRADGAHFAACIDGDGETCRVLDERGRDVPTDRLLLLLVRQALQSSLDIKPRPVVAPRSGATTGRGFMPEATPAIVLEQSTSSVIVHRIEELGVRVVTNGARRAEMAAAMNEHAAMLGGGPSGRFWHCVDGVPLPDALMTITRLLVLLSRSDEPLSAVLDRETPLG
jgi:phosphomannomutase